MEFHTETWKCRSRAVAKSVNKVGFPGSFREKYGLCNGHFSREPRTRNTGRRKMLEQFLKGKSNQARAFPKPLKALSSGGERPPYAREVLDPGKSLSAMGGSKYSRGAR